MPLRNTCLAASAATLLLLTGCSQLGMPWSSSTSGGSGTSTRPAPPAVCNAKAVQSFVGRTNTAQNVEQARQRAGASMARVLHPGQVTTREFDAGRLNLEVDATGRILAARCG